jgi:hypothetical protein
MKKRDISTMKELLNLIDEYSNKKLFFRGENKNNREKACLPHILRENGSCDFNHVIDSENLWFTEKLESLGVGTPYRPCKSDNTIDVIKNSLLSNPPWCWSLWNEDKYEALIQHYMIDFDPLKDLMEKTNLELYGSSFKPGFLDITSDITVALHFACSRFKFKLNNNDTTNETNTIGDGYVFVFDFSKLSEAKYIRLVSNPSYTYFYKKGDEYHFQSFDRITHQKGAFLAPNRDEKGSIDRCIWIEDIKNQIFEKITIKSNLKQELFKIFGGEKGLTYYFPKIPLLSPKNKIIADEYEKLEGITLLE